MVSIIPWTVFLGFLTVMSFRLGLGAAVAVVVAFAAAAGPDQAV